MKAVIGTCPCANSLDHLDFRLFIFGSHIQSQDEFTVRLIQDGIHHPDFRGSCSNMQILLIIWTAVMVHWQYYILNFLFQ